MRPPVVRSSLEPMREGVVVCVGGVPVWAGRLGEGGPNLRFEAELALWHNSVNAPPGPLFPSSHPSPEREDEAEKERRTPGQKDQVHVSILQTAPEAASASHQSPISSLHSCFREARAYAISLSEGREPDGGEREIEKDLHPQGADDDLGWVLYHWDGIG